MEQAEDEEENDEGKDEDGDEDEVAGTSEKGLGRNCCEQGTTTGEDSGEDTGESVEAIRGTRAARLACAVFRCTAA